MKTIAFIKEDNKEHRWVRASHWTEEYVQEMYNALNTWLKKYNKYEYYIVEEPLDENGNVIRCCELHGAKSVNPN